MVARFKKIRGELVKFYTKDELELSGFLIHSKPNNKKAILNVFGMSGNFFSSNRYWKLHQQATGSEFDLFLAANRGLGSEFPFKKKNGRRTLIGTVREKFEACVYDIDGALNFLKSLGYQKVILLGHSTGCQKVCYYQYKTRDKIVKGIVLLAPSDDYNSSRKKLGKNFTKAVRICKNMVKKQKGGELTPEWISHHTAKRFLSYTDLRNVEARLFNYDSQLKEFGSIKCPMLAVFGDSDVYAVKPAEECLKILEEKTASKIFNWKIIKNADHSFTNGEQELSRVIMDWLKKAVE